MNSREHFQEVHEKAFWSDILARIEGRPNDLLPYETLAAILQISQRKARPEPEMVPLDRIVGSVGRYRDFTRDFLPRFVSLRNRWTRIEQQINGLAGVPPIEVFKIGDVYFVSDGNHRVSVARANGFDSIEGYVTEIPIDPELEPGDSLDEAIVKAGRARFLLETGLDEFFPGLEDIRLTEPGGYTEMLEQIRSHQRCLSETEIHRSPVTFRDAAAHWYTEVYLPIIAAIRRRKLLSRYPDRTPADLYVWVSRTITDLSQMQDEPVTPEEAASYLQEHSPSRVAAALTHVVHRLGALSSHWFGQSGVPAKQPDSLESGDAEELDADSMEQNDV